MRNSRLFLERVVFLFPLFVCSIVVSAAQNEGANQNIFHYAVSNQVVTKNQKQNLFSVLKDLNKSRGVYFLFSDSSIANKQVSVPDMNGFIEEILSELLKNTGLKYKKISRNTFVITSDKSPSAEKSPEGNLYNLVETPYGELRFASVNSAYYAPPRKIIGKIVSGKDGKPLEGVSVKVKGQKIGTTTKEDGSFTLEVPDNATLEFSAIGYLTTTAKPNASGVVSITLQEAASDLEDVVVVAYGTQKRSTITGAATTVNTQMIEDVPRTSFQESLQGNAVGVLSTNGSGQPGSAPSIRIRGIGSISASSAPLYVIDGIPVVSGDISNGFNSNTLAAINAMDIQSTVILKDASATALYGSRGANGVILITTKKGRASKTTLLDCRLQTGANFYTQNKGRDRTLNTKEMVQYLREAWTNKGNDPAQFDDQLKQNQIDTTINTNWFNEILRTGAYSNLSLSASGGNEKTTFYCSGGIFNQVAPQRGIDYNKITSILNLNHKVNDRLTITAGISGAYQRSNSSVVGSTFENPARAMYRLQSWLTVNNPDETYRTDYNSGYNPIAMINENIRRTTTYVMRGTLAGNYKIVKGLTYEPAVGIDYSHAYNLQYSDPRYGNDNVASNGFIGNYNQDITNSIFTNLLRFKKVFFSDHSVEMFAGYEQSKRRDNFTSASGTNLTVLGKYSLSNAAVPGPVTGSPPNGSGLESYLFNTNYSFKNRYYASGSIRSDYSTRFGIGNRTGVFWSLGAGWDIYKEKFFNIRFINSLKIRGSIGLTGNSIGISDNGSQSLYTLNAHYDNQPGMLYYQIGNDKLTWEKNYPVNVGFDMSLLKNKLVLSVDLYTRKTTDLLYTVTTPYTNGIPSYSGNYGQMRNQGFEVSVASLNIVPKKVGGFKWATELNVSANRNTILKLPRPLLGTYWRAENNDFYQWRERTYLGVDPDNGEALWRRDTTKTNNSTVTDTIANANYYKQGSALPKFFGSITNTFSYKNFTFQVQLFVNWGNIINDDNGAFTSSDGSAGFSATGNVNIYNYEHRWRKKGDITDVPAPVMYGQQTGLNTQTSSRFMYDGSYIRVRDVTLAYSLTPKVLSKLRISSCRLYVRANNLFTIIKDKRLPYDPETPVDGTINLRPAKARTVFVGVNFNF